MLTESKSYFENLASQWVEDAYCTSRKVMPIGEQRKQLVLNIINRSPTSLRVLDIGSGGGQIAKALLQRGHHVTAVDRSSQMLSLLENECKKLDQKLYANLSTVHSCATDLDEKLISEKYDIIICVGMIYYLEDDSYIYKIIQKHLKPEGTAIITYRNKLFNMFPKSRSNDTSDLYNSHQEIKAINSNIEPVVFEKYLRNLRDYIDEALLIIDQHLNQNEQNSIIKNQENSIALEKEKVLGRQHTPSQVKHDVEMFQLKLTNIYGIQPHFLLAGSENQIVNKCLQVLSAPLTSLCAEKVSLLWSSHFMAELKKI